MPATTDDILARFLQKHQVSEGRLLVGVSGGPDSVSLLLGLTRMAGQFSLDIIAGHFDHGLRSASIQDAEWVRAFCERIGIRCVVGRDEFRSEEAGSSKAIEASIAIHQPEEVSRKRRYDFLARLAATEQCRWVAIAHTADDQAETVLHHIIRGTGIKGLAGIPARRLLEQNIALIRPLLQAQRRNLIDELDQIGQSYLTDITNLETGYTRNRLRREILPRLREEFNPQVDAALVRLAVQAAEASSLIGTLARDLLNGAVLDCQPEVTRLQRKILFDQPAVLIREALSQLWERQNWPRQPLASRHFDQLLKMIMTGDPARSSLPGGVEAQCRAEVIELRMSR
jgi:tRNA(Ile)-lysidine synthase